MTVPETLAIIPCILWNVELKPRDVSIGLCGNMPTIAEMALLFYGLDECLMFHNHAASDEYKV